MYYIATTFIGFESICESEIRSKLVPLTTRVLVQKVIFESEQDPKLFGIIKSGIFIIYIFICTFYFRYFYKKMCLYMSD